jgi:hypothetical protein
LRHVRAVRAGDVVNVTAEGHPFTAKVRAIVPAGDARSQSFEVLVSAPAVDGLLAPGNTVDVELPLGTPSQQIAVPRSSSARTFTIASTASRCREGQRKAGTPTVTGSASKARSI